MSSEAQIAASRTNGAKSHGPVTPEGKAKSSMNACTHGLTAQTIVLRGEDPNRYQQLIDWYVASVGPLNPMEMDVTVTMAGAKFRLERAHRAETAHLDIRIRAAPARFDSQAVGRSWRLFNRLRRADADFDDDGLAFSEELETFAEGVKRKLEFWTDVSRQPCWGYEQRVQGLLLLKKHPRWIHSDAVVQRIHLCINVYYGRVGDFNFRDLCRDFSRGWECTKIDVSDRSPRVISR